MKGKGTLAHARMGSCYEWRAGLSMRCGMGNLRMLSGGPHWPGMAAKTSHWMHQPSLLRVRPDHALLEATAHGEVRLTVVSAPGPGEKEDRRSDIVVPLTVPIIPTPPR